MRTGGRQRAGNALVVRVASKESVMYDSLKRVCNAKDRKKRCQDKAPIERFPE